MTPIDFAALGRLDAEATPGPWRVEDAHDLWREVRHGYGPNNRMVVDCAIGEDGPLIAALRNAAPDLLAVVRVLDEIIRVVDRDLTDFTQSPEDAAIEKRARAALSRFANLEEQP